MGYGKVERSSKTTHVSHSLPSYSTTRLSKGTAESPVHVVSIDQIDLQVHIYRLKEQDAVQHSVDDEEKVTSSNEWDLPARTFAGLWDALVFEENVPAKLLNFIYISMLFAGEFLSHYFVELWFLVYLTTTHDRQERRSKLDLLVCLFNH